MKRYLTALAICFGLLMGYEAWGHPGHPSPRGNSEDARQLPRRFWTQEMAVCGHSMGTCYLDLEIASLVFAYMVRHWSYIGGIVFVGKRQSLSEDHLQLEQVTPLVLRPPKERKPTCDGMHR